MQTGPFGVLLRRYRRAAELAQEELAARAGYSTDYVSKLERGTRQPSPTAVRVLSEALSLTDAERAVLQAAVETRAAPFLSGREKEVGAIRRLLVGEHQTLLALEGPLGIGKTRLLHEATRIAREAGMTVLEGAAYRSTRHRLYPVLEAISQSLALQRREDLPGLLRGCEWLVAVLPELAHAGLKRPSPLPPEQENRLIVAAMSRYLVNIGTRAGTLLVLDDLQWATPDALDRLADVVRAASPHRVRVLVAYRTTDLEPHSRLNAVLSDLQREGLAATMHPEPLTRVEARTLLRHHTTQVGLDAEQRETVVGRAGGVPLFLVSFAQVIRPGWDGSVPNDLAELIRQQVLDLPTAGQELLAVLAIMGRSTSRQLLSVTSELPRDEVLDGLDAASRRGLLSEDGPHSYRFTHHVVGEVLESDLSSARRALLHQRVVEALLQQREPVPMEELAYHSLRTDEPHRALPYLEAAGDVALEQHSYASAVQFYQTARQQSLNPVDDSRLRGKLESVYSAVMTEVEPGNRLCAESS